jgi:prepilin-type N-terminal cleavage/methylation domain-containing protein
MNLLSNRRGFTLVELLIVIAVISILAAITVVAYNGIQGRAADAAVQSDLKAMGTTLDAANTTSFVYPYDETTLSVMGLKATKTSVYGNHLMSGGMAYNALYCSTISGYKPADFAFIASSRSGNVYDYHNGKIESYPSASWTGGWGTMCPAILGVTAGNSSAGVWLYENSIWKIWLGS